MSQVRDGWSTTGTGGADQATLRRANLSLVLRALRDAGPRSRARLAADLGLNKATVSSLVTELRERGLVRDGRRRARRRRPPRRRASSSTVTGPAASAPRSTSTTSRPWPSTSRATWSASARIVPGRARARRPTRCVDRLAELVRETLADLGRASARSRLGGRGRRRPRRPRPRTSQPSAPTSAGSDVPVGQPLRGRPRRPRYPIEVDNEANLAAVAEAIPGDPERQDILVIFGEVGVGGGIVADGRPLRGRQGYAGEFGHMIVEPDGRRCGCGRIGLLGDRRRSQPRCSTWPPTPTTRCATRPRPRRPAGRAQPARRPRRHADPGRARAGRRLGSASAPRCSPTRSTPRRSCSAATSPRSASGMRPASRPSSPPACSPPTPAARAVELSTLGLHGRRARRRRPSPSSTSSTTRPLVARGPRRLEAIVMTDTPTTPRRCCRCTASSSGSPACVALGGVDLDVRAGEVHCLLGQNGAGKSTLIKVLSASYQPDEGEILWEGEPASLSTPRRRCEPGHRHDLPGARPGAEPRRRRERLPRPRGLPRRLQPARRTQPAGARAARPARALRDLADPARSAGCRPPPSRSSAWRARSPTTPGCSSSTSPPRCSTRRRSTTSSGSSAASPPRASRSSTSPTASRRSARSATGSPCSRTAAPSPPASPSPTPPPRELIKLMTGRSIEYVFPPRPERPAPPASPCWRCGTWRSPACSPASTSPCTPARSSGSPASSAPAAPRSSRPSTAPAGPRPAPSRSTASGCAAARSPRAVAAGVGLAPEERKSQGLLLDEADLPQHHRVLDGPVLPLRAPRPRRGAAPRRRGRRSPSTYARPAWTARCALLSGGNQQKVVLARWLLRELPGAAPRRADPRRRRRRPHRDLRPRPLAGRLRRRRRRRVQRGRGGARSRPTGCSSSARARSSTRVRRARSTRPGSSTWSWKERSHERAEHDRRQGAACENTGQPSTDTVPVERAAAEAAASRRAAALISASVGRNLGLVVALLLICASSASSRRATGSPASTTPSTILRLAGDDRRRQHRHDVRDHRRRHRPLRRRDRGALARSGARRSPPRRWPRTPTGCSWSSSRWPSAPAAGWSTAC